MASESLKASSSAESDSSSLHEKDPSTRPEAERSQCRGGYDCQFVGEILPEEGECPICDLIYSDPHQMRCCGKRICGRCVEKIKAKSQPCPFCKEVDVSPYPDKAHMQSLGSYKVNCPNRSKHNSSEGCEWEGQLSELDRHLNLEPMTEKQLKGCLFSKIKCRFCFELFERHFINTHHSQECLKRPYECAYCEYKASFEEVTQHSNECPSAPVTCPNNCELVVFRSDLERHRNHDCPLEIEQCEFRAVGCQVELPRKDMPEHKRQNVAEHSVALSTTLQRAMAAPDYFKENVSHSQTYSLPVVKKYFHFADALELSFLQPIEVITLTSEGKVIMNDKEGISIHVPDGAIPVGKRLSTEVGSAMYGKLSFPEGMHPVSSILWICPQEEMDLLKPFKITLPHTVKYEEGVTDLVFLKACHKEFSGVSKLTTMTFKFEEMNHHERFEFNEVNGSVFTKQFCCICIAQKVPQPGTKRYLLFHAQPRNRKSSKFSIEYCITYTLPTCVETFRKRCNEMDLEVNCDWPEFTFSSEGKLELHTTDLPPEAEWMVDIKKKVIKEDEVNFWKYDFHLLSEYQKLRRYPPRMSIDLYRGKATRIYKLKMCFSG